MWCVFKGDDVVEKRGRIIVLTSLFTATLSTPPLPCSSDSHTLPRTHTIGSVIVHVNLPKGFCFLFCHFFLFVCFVFAGARAANQECHSTISNIYTESNNQEYCKINKNSKKIRGGRTRVSSGVNAAHGGVHRGACGGLELKCPKKACPFSHFIIDVCWALRRHFLYDVNRVSVIAAHFLVMWAEDAVSSPQRDDDVAWLRAVVVAAAAAPLGRG